MNDIAKNIESTPAPPPGLSEKKIRLAFIHAPDPIYSSNQDYGAKFMPTWVYALASHIPDIGRFSLRLHDMRFEKEADIAEADLFLFSGINQDNGILNRLRESVKRRFPRSRSFVGGPICWSFDQAGTLDQIDAFDHICIGDGEEMIAEIVESACQGHALPHIIRAAGRFDLSRAVPLHRELLESTISRYYGAVVEVSRGCPFLCEFCDIRVLPDNNRSHVKDPDLIVEELDFLSRQGVRQFLFACDNFIGNPQWAEELVDKILAWEERTGFRANLYTWLTINLFRTPGLMKKMRRAGFDMLFIGVESFDANSLLETAKVQNTAQEMVEALRLIQSHGFIVVGGLI
ncbi:MAG: radical SAM protein, partial [bacterium]